MIAKLKPAISCLAILVFICSCKKDKSEPSPYLLIDEYLAQNADEYPAFEETDSGVVYIIDKEGTGDLIQSGDLVIVHYTGYHLNDEVFDSSYKNGYPYSFIVDESFVMEGWHVAFKYLKKGSEATLFIPSYLAYGENGSAGIAPNEDLKFEVKIIDVK